MTALEIMDYAPINSTNESQVQEIVESIYANGWQGAPILVSEAHSSLITGSHRLAALRYIADNDWEFDLDSLGDVAESVDDIIDDYCERYDCTINSLPYDNLEQIFAGTWVEQYKNDLVEW